MDQAKLEKINELSDKLRAHKAVYSGLKTFVKPEGTSKGAIVYHVVDEPYTKGVPGLCGQTGASVPSLHYKNFLGVHLAEPNGTVKDQSKILVAIPPELASRFLEETLRFYESEVRALESEFERL